MSSFKSNENKLLLTVPGGGRASGVLHVTVKYLEP